MIDRGALYLSFMYISAAVQVHDNDNGHAQIEVQVWTMLRKLGLQTTYC